PWCRILCRRRRSLVPFDCPDGPRAIRVDVAGPRRQAEENTGIYRRRPDPVSSTAWPVHKNSKNSVLRRSEISPLLPHRRLVRIRQAKPRCCNGLARITSCNGYGLFGPTGLDFSGQNRRPLGLEAGTSFIHLAERSRRCLFALCAPDLRPLLPFYCAICDHYLHRRFILPRASFWP